MCQHVPPLRYPSPTPCYTVLNHGRSAKPARSLLTELFRAHGPGVVNRLLSPVTLFPEN
jgi:hypothetical protein